MKSTEELVIVEGQGCPIVKPDIKTGQVYRHHSGKLAHILGVSTLMPVAAGPEAPFLCLATGFAPGGNGTVKINIFNYDNRLHHHNRYYNDRILVVYSLNTQIYARTIESFLEPTDTGQERFKLIPLDLGCKLE